MKLSVSITCGLLLGFLAACKDQNKAAETAAAQGIQASDTIETVQRMNEYHYTDQVKWRGKTVSYVVERHAVDSLPVVADEQGTQYVDNVITLSVTDGDRSIFRKSFTKNTFKTYMETGFYKHSILEGMAFDRERDGNLCFAVSVSYPMSDLYIPLLIAIRPDGSYEITKDQVLDNVVETLDTTGME